MIIFEGDTPRYQVLTASEGANRDIGSRDRVLTGSEGDNRDIRLM